MEITPKKVIDSTVAAYTGPVLLITPDNNDGVFYERSGNSAIILESQVGARWDVFLNHFSARLVDASGRVRTGIPMELGILTTNKQYSPIAATMQSIFCNMLFFSGRIRVPFGLVVAFYGYPFIATDVLEISAILERE